MDILVLVEFGIYLIFICKRTYKAYRNLCGFLHNVTQRACGLNLACAFHNKHLKRHKHAARRGPGKSVYCADFILLCYVVLTVFCNTEIIL